MKRDSASLPFDREYYLISVMAGLGCADGKEKERTVQKSADNDDLITVNLRSYNKILQTEYRRFMILDLI